MITPDGYVLTQKTFGLNNAGDTIYLNDTVNTVIDSISYTSDPGVNKSIGRKCDGSDEWVVFDIPTPGAANSNTSCNVGCTSDSECGDRLYCNGIETCIVGTGQCIAGTPVSCGDNVSCTVDSCNEQTGSCLYTPSNSLCSDGAYCNGI